MCSVRDRWEDYVATGAEVVGISTDSVESHRSLPNITSCRCVCYRTRPDQWLNFTVRIR